ncbi:uncharacterized protein N7459_008617 [Penicillium hispanicum]|uniref:uncharacterized protein n=1 Tax=Penicillium hispanicum TaxID=1080232 RepID=UPI0025415D14|nr:uncharacterized protein N7459_008617 [Penicillium hispanicum]KAJ5574190.1 hypothetical protein N7459_008617 [Penicillium hispanicum]
MVLLVSTDRIVDALEAVPPSCREELDLPVMLEPRGPITHEQLLRLSKHLQQDPEYNATNDTNRIHSPTLLSSLLRGTKVYVPPPPKKPEPVCPTHASGLYFHAPTTAILIHPQSPEYLASKARLLAAAERAAYQRLMNPTYTPSPDHADPHVASSDAPIFTEDTLTPSLVLNIFLSVLITGFSVYWALTNFTMPDIFARIFSAWTGPRTDSQGQPAAGASDAVRVLLSLFAALVVAVAEAFLYASYLGKVERARVKERKLKERKVVVGEVEDETMAPLAPVDEKEEIWGKGVNGGVRRRVREKWEKENDRSGQNDG